MIAAMERYVTIKGTKEELHELLETLESRMHMGLDAYLWHGCGVVVKFEMTEEAQYKSPSASDGADNVPVDEKKCRPVCNCEKCVKARVARSLMARYTEMRENAGLPPLDEPKGITQHQYADLWEYLDAIISVSAFSASETDTPSIAICQILEILGIEHKGLTDG